MTQEDIYKSPVITNIQNMQSIIGVSVTPFTILNEKSYNELYEEQLELVEYLKYAINNYKFNRDEQR